MKLSVFIAAFLAGIVSLCAHATPVAISVMEFENDAYFIENPTASMGLFGFERTLMERYRIEIRFDEPAVALQPVPPLDLLPLAVFEATEQGPVEAVLLLAPPPELLDLGRAEPVDMLFVALLDERVPEPGSLLLIGTGLLMLSSRRLFWRRGF